jgi:hypothetical protein
MNICRDILEINVQFVLPNVLVLANKYMLVHNFSNKSVTLVLLQSNFVSLRTSHTKFLGSFTLLVRTTLTRRSKLDLVAFKEPLQPLISLQSHKS